MVTHIKIICWPHNWIYTMWKLEENLMSTQIVQAVNPDTGIMEQAVVVNNYFGPPILDGQEEQGKSYIYFPSSGKVYNEYD